jgi:ABC-type multidrug transport system ATPase subunit
MNLLIDSVGKQYRGNVWGLQNISLQLRPGVLGLLGPNGAGKSTLMRILATVTRPTRGCVLWNDADVLSSPDPLRMVLGYLPQDFGVYPQLSAFEFLEYLAAVKGLEPFSARRRIVELLSVVNLTDVHDRPLGGFSGGMGQRVGIAQALLNDPQLLIVDEPTAGRRSRRARAFPQSALGTSGERIVILSMHIVSDLEAVATDIAILNHGLLLAHDSPESLLAAISGKVWEILVPSAALPSIQQQHLITSTAHRSDGVHVRVVSNSPPMPQAQPLEPTLEDASSRTAPVGVAS